MSDINLEEIVIIVSNISSLPLSSPSGVPILCVTPSVVVAQPLGTLSALFSLGTLCF